MSSFVIEGGRPLAGDVQIAGNKNAALPMLAATLLTDEVVTLENVPAIRDVLTMHAVLADLGADVTAEGAGRITSRTTQLRGTRPDPTLCQTMRASFVLAGALLGRAGRAELGAPGGDKIGRRPVDTHVVALRELGVEIEVLPDRYRMSTPRGLRGAEIFLAEMSVMATENVLMAAVLARGTTVLRNAASEPHVQDLCRLLLAMGAGIDGVGTSTLTIQGVDRLHGCRVRVGPDYLEVGSFIALAAIGGGEMRIRDAAPTSTARPPSPTRSSASPGAPKATTSSFRRMPSWSCKTGCTALCPASTMRPGRDSPPISPRSRSCSRPRPAARRSSTNGCTRAGSTGSTGSSRWAPA